MIVVSNSGPLIALARIGRLDLLRAVCGKLLIPQAVRDELVVSGGYRPGAYEVAAAGWIEVVRVRDVTAVRLLQNRLDAGESEAVVLAIELGADLLLMDEARGRRVAEAQAINLVGTVGLLVEAKRQGVIDAVTPLLEKLRSGGFRMSKDLFRTGQQLAGEAS